MDELASKVPFKRSVRLLFKIHQIFGLINVTYNQVTKRFEESSHKRRIFRCSLAYCGLSSLVLTFFSLLLLGLSILADIIPYYLCMSSEQFIFRVDITLMAIKGIFFSINYYTYRNIFAETLNRLIRLSERVQKLTADGSLYYPGKFRKLIILRVAIFVIVGFPINIFRTGKPVIMTCFFFVHCNVLMELSFWTYVYGHLTLMCFYQKMNNLLSVMCATASQRKIKRRIRQMTSISYEIHRVKKQLNDVFNTLHVFYCFGIFNDISSVYGLMKLIVIITLNKVHLPPWKIYLAVSQLIFRNNSALANLYLSSLIAEELAESETKFRRKLLISFHENEPLQKDTEHQREIDLALMHHSIQDITTRSLKLFVIDRRFLSLLISEIIVTNAIVMFQQFVGEYVSATGDRLQQLERSLVED